MKCAYCNANGDTTLHRDHVVPRSRGGPDNALNIVMACQSCNSAKRDSTATEWLGDRCPNEVREIEERVNKKLGADFAKRDVKKKSVGTPRPKLYALTINDRGAISYVGEVIEERGDFIRLEAADPVMMWAGFWSLSGCLYDVKREQCRLFNDLEACVMRANAMCDALKT
jgi:hypothetical protein